MLPWMLLLSHRIIILFQASEIFLQINYFIQGAMQQNYVINTPYHSTDTMILPHGNEEVNVPRSTFQPCRQLELNLRMIDPLTPSASNGQDIYCLIVDVVGHHLSSECSNCI